MKYCDKCKLKIAGKRKYCPLCQNLLSGSDEDQEEVFPHITTLYRRYTVFFRIMIFVSVAAAVISVLLNMLIPSRRAWSFFVVIGIGCMWVSLYTAINKRNNIPKNITYQVCIVAVVVMIWDYITGRNGWSIDYVIPIMCIVAMVFLAVISKIMKMEVEDYILYLIIGGIFGILPVIFIATGKLRVLYPSMICVAASIISLTALIVFYGPSMSAELKRRLHM